MLREKIELNNVYSHVTYREENLQMEDGIKPEMFIKRTFLHQNKREEKFEN